MDGYLKTFLQLLKGAGNFWEKNCGFQVISSDPHLADNLALWIQSMYL
jgi:hypothetical protein